MDATWLQEGEMCLFIPVCHLTSTIYWNKSKRNILLIPEDITRGKNACFFIYFQLSVPFEQALSDRELIQ